VGLANGVCSSEDDELLYGEVFLGEGLDELLHVVNGVRELNLVLLCLGDNVVEAAGGDLEADLAIAEDARSSSWGREGEGGGGAGGEQALSW
jgi:hypothetical protein